MAKRCRHCKAKFEPTYSSMQICCSPKCALSWAKTDKGKGVVSDAKVKEARKWTREKRKELKSVKTVCAEVQRDVNKYIRTRDQGRGCISCQATEFQEAGHYYAVGSKYQCNRFRFEPTNIHGQCTTCNHFVGGGNAEAFRYGLVVRYGEAYVQGLDVKHTAADQSQDKLTKEEVWAIGVKFRKMTRALEA